MGDKTSEINSFIKNALKNNEFKKTLEIINLPDSYQGAFIYRNGIDFSVALINNFKKDDINIEKKMQSSINLPVNIKIK